ncbi:hypothetical protein [Actinoplanes friuliensis]|nr:hypothetical protein [Actinoplanes friuliensis]
MVMAPVPDYDDLIWLFEDEPAHRYVEDKKAAGYDYRWRRLWLYTCKISW